MIWVHTSHLKLAFERIIWFSSSRHWEWKLSQENQAQSCPPSGTSRNRLDWQKSLCQILSTRATLAPLYFSHLYFVCCLFLISPAVFVFLCLLYFSSTWEGAWLLLPPLPNLSQTGPRFAGNRGRGRKKRFSKQKQGRRVCSWPPLFTAPRSAHRPEWSGARADHTGNGNSGKSGGLSFIFIVSFCRIVSSWRRQKF